MTNKDQIREVIEEYKKSNGTKWYKNWYLLITLVSAFLFIGGTFQQLSSTTAAVKTIQRDVKELRQEVSERISKMRERLGRIEGTIGRERRDR